MRTRRLFAWLAGSLALAGCTSGSAQVEDAGSPGSDDGGGGGADAPSAPPEAGDAGALVSVPLSACFPVVYSARVTIGGSQPFELVLDTGSTTLAVAGAGCTSCSAAGVSALYEPGPTAVDQHMTASASYGALAPSGWSGEVYDDEVGAGAPAAAAHVRFASIQQQNAFLVGRCGASGAPPQGAIGFAPSRTATPGTNGFFDQLVAAGMPDVFAVRLCAAGGTLWLGGYDVAAAAAPPVFTPTYPPGFDAYAYTVELSSVAVLGTTVAVATGAYTATLLDTGSSISSLPPAAFTALTSAIASSPAFAQVFGAAASSFFSDSNGCVHLDQTKDALDATLPPLVLSFGSNPSVTAQARATESYLLTTGDGRWCPAVTSRAPTPDFQSIAAILGAPMLRSNVLVFDRANHRVGFAPHAPCPP